MDQRQIDRMLKWGIIFSLVWLAGLGSLFSVISGLKAKKAINASNGSLIGIRSAWWCIIVGSLGIVFWLPLILAGIKNQF